MDQAMNGRWIPRLNQYHFETVHRSCTQQKNAEGLSKRPNSYVHWEKIIEMLPEVSNGFSFMTQKGYEELPTEPYFDNHGRKIPDHPEFPGEARAQLPVQYFLRKQSKQTPVEKNLMVLSHGTRECNGIRPRGLMKMTDQIAFLV